MLTEKAINTRLERINVIFDQLSYKIDCLIIDEKGSE